MPMGTIKISSTGTHIPSRIGWAGFSLADAKEGDCTGCRYRRCRYGGRRFRSGNILGLSHCRRWLGGCGRRSVRHHWLGRGRKGWLSRGSRRRNWLNSGNNRGRRSNRSWRRSSGRLNCRRKWVSWESFWSVLSAANRGGCQSGR